MTKACRYDILLSYLLRFRKGEQKLSGKRKDRRGRVLKVGEAQRKDGTYAFRYTYGGKRRDVYARTLEELRRKEAAIHRDMADGIDYTAGEITVSELIDRYINLRRGLKQNSMRAYSTAVNRIHKDEFGKRKINTIKLSDAKSWFVKLHDEGFKRNTIEVMQSVVRPAFEMAVDDDIIRKNPFKFNLAELIPDDAYVRQALTKAQQERYLRFIREEHKGRGSYYDDIVILLETGLRVSELYGLTKSDVDLKNRRISICRQLCRTAEKAYFVTAPKTKSGVRSIPLSDAAYLAFARVIQNRKTPKVEMIVDGCTGFLFLDKDGRPKVAMHLQNYMKCIRKKYVEKYGDTMPSVTPHVLRHTFCTNLQPRIDVKSLQYLMGHSNASVTLDVYSHSDYDTVERAFREAMKLA